MNQSKNSSNIVEFWSKVYTCSLLRGVYCKRLYVPPSNIEPNTIDDVLGILFNKLFYENKVS